MNHHVLELVANNTQAADFSYFDTAFKVAGSYFQLASFLVNLGRRTFVQKLRTHFFITNQ